MANDIETQIANLDLCGQIDAINAKQISADELLEATIAKIERLNPINNAVLTTCFDKARADVKQLPPNSAAQGAPFLIKDLQEVQGVRTTFGMGAFSNYQSKESDVYVKKIEAAGFAIVGKTNTPELGLLPITEPLAYGAAKNPWDLARSTGGSSGGAAAAVASGMMPCAHATDGGGSIRVPAHYCGLFGLKPSRNRVTSKYRHKFPIAVCGALSQTVRDNAFLLSLTETANEEREFPAIGMVSGSIDRPLKIGLALDDYFVGENICEPEITTAIEKTAKLLEHLGHKIEIAKPPVFGSELVDAFLVLWASTLNDTIAAATNFLGRPVSDSDVEPWTRELAKMFNDNGGQAGLEIAIEKLKLAEHSTVEFLSKYDVLLSPVAPSTAPLLGQYETHNRAAFRAGFEKAARSVGYCAIYNVAGAPAMSVPLFSAPSGLPIGSQFTAAPANDALLLQLAYQLEQANPWNNKR